MFGRKQRCLQSFLLYQYMFYNCINGNLSNYLVSFGWFFWHWYKKTQGANLCCHWSFFFVSGWSCQAVEASRRNGQSGSPVYWHYRKRSDRTCIKVSNTCTHTQSQAYTQTKTYTVTCMLTCEMSLHGKTCIKDTLQTHSAQTHDSVYDYVTNVYAIIPCSEGFFLMMTNVQQSFYDEIWIVCIWSTCEHLNKIKIIWMYTKTLIDWVQGQNVLC